MARLSYDVGGVLVAESMAGGDVAITVGSGVTQIVRPQHARELAQSILEVCEKIEKEDS